MEYNIIEINKSKVAPLITGHPWVFSGALLCKYPNLKNGEIVKLFCNSNYVATGVFNNNSIAFKVLSFNENDVIDSAFIINNIKSIHNNKKSLYVNEENNGFRLVNADADYLPGLIIDVFHNLAVFQVSSILMESFIADIILALKQLNFAHIVEKSDSESRKLDGLLVKKPIVHYGVQQSSYKFLENGITMLCDPLCGQKTGFFLDQKLARNWLKHNSKNKKVVNLFSYSGGFGVSALIGEARAVINVDVSKEALQLAELIFQENNASNSNCLYSCIKSDVFEYLQQDFQADVLICDPPAFAKNKASLDNAVKAYVKINAKCLSKLSVGNIFITSSCSGLLKMEDFINIIKKACLQANKKVKILHEFKQHSDHSIILGFKEGEYLKTLILEII